MRHPLTARSSFASFRIGSLVTAVMTAGLLLSPTVGQAVADEGDAPAKPAQPAKPAPKTAPMTESKPAEKPAERAPGQTGTEAGTAKTPAAGRSYSRASDWQLDFKPGALRLYIDPQTKTNYWYFTYKVVNRSTAERAWLPRFEFFSDRGEIKVSGQDVPSRVSEDILTLLGNPLLEDQNEILGDLLVGEENAKDGLVVWPAGDADINEMTVFVTGASGRVRKVVDTKTREMRSERWTLRFNYLLPGEALPRGSEPVNPTHADQDVKDGAERRADDTGVWLWR